MKIHDALIRAITNGTPLNQQNTIYDGNKVYLHGNLLCEHLQNVLRLTDGNYPSRTTQRRLQAIVEAHRLPIKVRFLKGTIYFEYKNQRYPNRIEILI